MLNQPFFGPHPTATIGFAPAIDIQTMERPQ
jgi:hypothetical protein